VKSGTSLADIAVSVQSDLILPVAAASVSEIYCIPAAHYLFITVRQKAATYATYTEKLQIQIKTQKIHIKADKTTNMQPVATDAMNVCITASFMSFLLEAQLTPYLLHINIIREHSSQAHQNFQYNIFTALWMS